MSLDQGKRLQTAEQLLKQGKTDAALAELRRLADETPGDLLTLNRVGDLLARQKRTGDAIGYYRRIADKFTAGGYISKAVAIHKKILRLDPDHTDSLIELGRLYGRQKLPADAAAHMGRAAEIFESRDEWAEALAVHEELLAVNPGNHSARERLARAMAALGQAEGAGEELLRIGDSLLDSQPEAAESNYRQAGEHLPDRHEPSLGLARSLLAQGREEEGLQLLEQTLEQHGDPIVRGELIVRSEMANRAERTVELLRSSGPEGVTDETLEHLFRYRAQRGETAALWDRFHPILQAWQEQLDADRMIALYQRLATVEESGHLPALERVIELLEGSSEPRRLVAALEQAIAAAQAAGEISRVAEWTERVEALSPTTATGSAADAGASDQTDADGAAADPILTPAVPLTRDDKEFVSGRLTQADILDNYGLTDQAIQQAREAVERFPGDVTAQRRLVQLIKLVEDETRLGPALVGLALATRAAGDHDEAAETAEEALALALSPAERDRLQQAGLLEEPTAAAAPVPDPTPTPVPPTPSPAAPVASRPTAVPAADIHGAIAVDDDDDDDCIVIDFDAEAPAAAAAPAPPAPAVRPSPPAPVAAESAAEGNSALVEAAGALQDSNDRIPGDEMLAEISLYIESGRLEDASRRVKALRDLGYGGATLAALAETVEATLPSTAASPEAPALTELAGEPDDDMGFDLGTADEMLGEAADGGDDDLSTIAAALEAELLEEEGVPLTPDAGSEQSIQEVFTQFRERVDEQVASDDHQTHYDLGIGYKEMGLLAEAIQEFEIALASPTISREAMVMIAVCHREIGDQEAAIAAYRRAVDATLQDVGAVIVLRYELGELLLQVGETAAALTEFQQVRDSDPAFRDVETRIQELAQDSAD